MENKLKLIKVWNEYFLIFEVINVLVFKYYIYDFFDLIDCCDFGYYVSLNRVLRIYFFVEYNFEIFRYEGLDIIENVVDNLEFWSDK